MKERMKQTIKLRQVGTGSLGISLPPEYIEWLQAKEGDTLQIMDDTSKHGRHISIWKKEEVKQ